MKYHIEARNRFNGKCLSISPIPMSYKECEQLLQMEIGEEWCKYVIVPENEVAFDPTSPQNGAYANIAAAYKKVAERQVNTSKSKRPYRL